MNTPAQKPKGRVRHCPYCGDDMGFIEDRYYERNDPCGKQSCMREASDCEREERDNAHDQLDRDNGWY